MPGEPGPHSPTASLRRVNDLLSQAIGGEAQPPVPTGQEQLLDTQALIQAVREKGQPADMSKIFGDTLFATLLGQELRGRNVEALFVDVDGGRRVVQLRNLPNFAQALGCTRLLARQDSIQEANPILYENGGLTNGELILEVRRKDPSQPWPDWSVTPTVEHPVVQPEQVATSPVKEEPVDESRVEALLENLEVRQEKPPGMSLGEKALDEFAKNGIVDLQPHATVDEVMKRMVQKGWQDDAPTRDYIQAGLDELKRNAAAAASEVHRGYKNDQQFGQRLSVPTDVEAPSVDGKGTALARQEDQPQPPRRLEDLTPEEQAETDIVSQAEWVKTLPRVAPPAVEPAGSPPAPMLQTVEQPLQFEPKTEKLQPTPRIEWNDIAVLPPNRLEAVFASLPPETIACALRGASAAVYEKFLSNATILQRGQIEQALNLRGRWFGLRSSKAPTAEEIAAARNAILDRLNAGAEETPAAETPEIPAPGEDQLSPAERSRARKIWHGLKTGVANWVNNLDPRGKDKAWFAGAIVGVAESAAFIWLPVPGIGWVKAAFNLAVAREVYVATRKLYGVEEKQVRRRYQGEELVQRLAELEHGHKLAAGRVRNFFLGVSAGATYASAAGLGIEIARSVAQEFSLSAIADKIQADLQAKINAQAPAVTSQIPPVETPTPQPSLTPPEVQPTPPEPMSPVQPTPDVVAAEAAVSPPAPEEAPTLPGLNPEVVAVTPESLLEQLGPDAIKEVDIPQDSTVSHILVNNGYPITWTPADAEVWASHIATNYDMLHSFWDQMVAAGHATGDFPVSDLDDLKELLAQAKSPDAKIAAEAQQKLIRALHWIPAGGKFKVLTPEGVASVLRMLR